MSLGSLILGQRQVEIYDLIGDIADLKETIARLQRQVKEAYDKGYADGWSDAVEKYNGNASLESGG